jgi:hypothetical protein
MNYFFVCIQFYVDNEIQFLSTPFKSNESLTKKELIEKCILKNIVQIFDLGYSKIYDIMHDGKTNVICYSRITKNQYNMYKKL